MKNLGKILLTFLLVVICVHSSLQAQNLITNGDFESGMGSWAFSSTNGSSATSSIVTDTIHTGTNALKIVVSNSGTQTGDVELVGTGFAVEKDLVYVLTFWAYSDSTNFETTVLFSSTSTSGFMHYDSTNLKLSMGWKQYKAIFPSPVTTASDIQFSLQMGKSVGTVFLDDFSLEQKSDNWYDGAALRIEKYREGNFSFKVLDKNDNPVSDTVIISQDKHEFPWGTAIDLTEKPFGNTYTAGQPITVASDSEVYRTERWANFLSYQLPASPNTHYQITLELSENYFTAANRRVFNVLVDGAVVICTRRRRVYRF